MNTNFYSLIHSLGAFFNVSISESEEHAWFEVDKSSKVLVTIINDTTSLLLNITLGKIPECFPKDLLVHLIIENEEISKVIGPRFSYLEKNNVLAIMDVIDYGAIDEEGICRLIDSLTTFACEMKEAINKLGYTLSMENQ
ncbi:hypothetical protein D5952_14265 [Salmonella enterica subsp. enterica]|nr:hypothetical protein [Salmonella enterica subsp. enterica serovar Bonn]EBZ5939345.1 hypothetical protein [Salmonella enterica subsp. enterica serovar Muenchen]MLZ41088.1 hypothetical protein [Salmonella enterica subsp. enterica serovar Bonn]